MVKSLITFADLFELNWKVSLLLVSCYLHLSEIELLQTILNSKVITHCISQLAQITLLFLFSWVEKSVFSTPFHLFKSRTLLPGQLSSLEPEVVGCWGLRTLYTSWDPEINEKASNWLHLAPDEAHREPCLLEVADVLIKCILFTQHYGIWATISPPGLFGHCRVWVTKEFSLLGLSSNNWSASRSELKNTKIMGPNATSTVWCREKQRNEQNE